MKKYKIFITQLIIISLIFSIFSIRANAQINVFPDGTWGECPEEYISYSVNNYGYDCEFKWTVTNGIFMETGTTSYTGPSYSVWVKWNNTTSSGLLNVETINCFDDADNVSAPTITVAIHSINGVTPDLITGSSSIEIGEKAITYSVPTFLYPNRTSDDGNLEVDSYKWLFPVGWSINGVVSNGITPFTGLEKSVNVVTDPSSGGVIKVWGHTDCGEGYDSNARTLTVTRNFPTFEIVSSTTNTFVYGDKTPITMSVPVWSFTNYTWTKPATWTWVDNTGNTVTVIPDGCTSGTISCRVFTNYIETTKTKIFPFSPYTSTNPPYVTGTNPVCEPGATYTILNTPQFRFNTLAIIALS